MVSPAFLFSLGKGDVFILSTSRKSRVFCRPSTSSGYLAALLCFRTGEDHLQRPRACWLLLFLSDGKELVSSCGVQLRCRSHEITGASRIFCRAFDPRWLRLRSASAWCRHIGLGRRRQNSLCFLSLCILSDSRVRSAALFQLGERSVSLTL